MSFLFSASSCYFFHGSRNFITDIVPNFIITLSRYISSFEKIVFVCLRFVVSHYLFCWSFFSSNVMVVWLSQSTRQSDKASNEWHQKEMLMHWRLNMIHKLNDCVLKIVTGTYRYPHLVKTKQDIFACSYTADVRKCLLHVLLKIDKNQCWRSL